MAISFPLNVVGKAAFRVTADDGIVLAICG
jgi:hypothetical protein